MLPAQDSWRVNTAHVSSFVLISILRGQPRTPPSGDNLGVLDYHLKTSTYFVWLNTNPRAGLNSNYSINNPNSFLLSKIRAELYVCLDILL